MAIDFIYTNNTSNLGDLLSSPKTYFKFESSEDLTILGGGVQNINILNSKLSHDYRKTILWGGGVSWPSPKEIPQLTLEFLAWGVRDRALTVNEDNFLPCVSCMHPMIDYARSSQKNDKTLLYINADPYIYSLNSLFKTYLKAKINGIQILTNRAPEEKFIDIWSRSNKIITNSYHGAYWSLLAGKQVSLFGYSVKFNSLLQSFGILEAFPEFRKGHQKELMSATKVVMSDKCTFLTLQNSNAILDSYRDKQLKFANHLKEIGLIKKYELLSIDKVALKKEKLNTQIMTIAKLYASAYFRRLRA